MSLRNYSNKLYINVCLMINKYFNQIEYIFTDFDKLKIDTISDFDCFMNLVQKKNNGEKMFLYSKQEYDFYKRYEFFIKDDSTSVVAYNFFRNNSLYAYYYEYVKSNRDSMDRVNDILNKFKSLGFESIIFNPSLEFRDEYSLYKTNMHYDHFTYLDHMKVIPTFEEDIIRYKGDNSNFTLSLNVDNYSDGIISADNLSDICVNGLLFDLSLIPDSLTDAYNEILELKSKNIHSFNLLSDSVQLNVGIDDIKEKIKELQSVVDNLKVIDDKDAINEYIERINNEISELSSYVNGVVLESSKNDSNITPMVLSRQKSKYLRRRELQRMDLD